MVDLSGAGSSTVRDTLEWVILFMAMYKNVQDKDVNKIKTVIGFERPPTYADRSGMPYTQAVIQETLRKATVTPFTIVHMAEEDTTLAGYVIPKGYHIYVNVWALHNDRKYWTQPEVFNPDRFLSEDKTKLIKHDSFMPFGHGKRSCPGESLAQVELFMYLVKILQKFEVCAPDGVELHDNGMLAALTYAAKPQQLVFKSRQ